MRRPEADILFWTQSKVETPGDQCTIHSIDLPTLELVFEPKEFMLPGVAQPVTRYVCDDLKGMWLAEDPNQPQLQRHLDGLRIGVWLEG